MLPDETPSGAQGWFINTRREQVQGPAACARRSIYAFDFEWTNKNIMYGAYERTHSVFQNSDMMAKGKPTPEELALLEPFRGKVPDEVFGEPFVPPVSDGSGQDRALLRKASQLLQEAGLRRSRTASASAAEGRALQIEFLIDEPSFQPHHMPFIKNLATLGIDATLRIVDAAQYRARVEDFDFDMTIERFGFSATPGDALRPFFSSQAAATKGSYNLAGIADPAIDALIDKVIAADTPRRADRSPAARSTACSAPAATGCRTGTSRRTGSPIGTCSASPPSKPRYARRGVPETWWYDRRQGARKLGAGEDRLMTAYIIRRILLMIPTLFGIMLVSFVVVQFAPGGPVERVIAQLSGADTGATSRIAGSAGGDFGARGAQVGASADAVSSKYRGAQGLDPEFIKKLEKQFGFDKPAHERFFLMLRNFCAFDFGKSYFRDVSVLQLIKEKLPVSMSLGIWMTLLTYLISIPLGIRKAVQDGSRFDTWTSGVIIIGYAIPGFLFAILLIILFAGGSFFDMFPLRGLTSDNWAQLPWSGRSSTISGT